MTSTPGSEAPRLHVVTGKGGTGKTTLAAALAISLAGAGRRVLLCEVEGRQGLSRLLGTEELPYAEVDVAEGVDGGQVVGLAVEPRAALLDYLDTFHGGRRPGRTTGGRNTGRAAARLSTVLDRAGAVDVIATVAPGLRDVLLIGKVYEAVRRTTSGGRGGPGDTSPPVYDAVVLDAPPTGRITRFLGIGAELAQLAAGGPIAARAASVAELLRSPQTAVHLVALPEELPVTETVEAAAELRAAGLPVGAVVANRVLPAQPDPGTGAEPALVAALSGVDDDQMALAARLTAQARARARRTADQQHWIEVLATAAQQQPVRRLPDLSGGIDLDGLYRLADDLAAAPLTSPPLVGSPLAGSAR